MAKSNLFFNNFHNNNNRAFTIANLAHSWSSRLKKSCCGEQNPLSLIQTTEFKNPEKQGVNVLGI